MSELYDLTVQIFQLKVQTPKPSFDPELMKTISRFDIKSSKSKPPTPETVVEKYQLLVNERYKLVFELQQNHDSINSSERNQQTASILIIQSFLALLYHNIDVVPVQNVQIFIQSLNYAHEINKSLDPYICDLFHIYCSMTLKSKNFYSLLSSIDSTLQQLPVKSKIAKYLLKSLIKITDECIYDSKVSIKFHIFSTMRLFQKFDFMNEIQETNSDLGNLIKTLTSKYMAKMRESTNNYFFLLMIFVFYLNSNNEEVIANLDEFFIELLIKSQVEFPDLPDKIIKYNENRTLSDLPSIEYAFRQIPGDISNAFFAFLNIHDYIIDKSLDHFLMISLNFQHYNVLFNLILLNAGTTEFYIDIKNPMQTFFNPLIFNPTYSLYDQEIHPLIAMRKFSIGCFIQFLKLDSSLISAYFTFLSSNTSYPWLFAEVLAYSKDIISTITNVVHASILIECIYQLMLTKADLPVEDNFFPAIFSSIYQFISNPKIYEQIMINPIFIDIIFNNSIEIPVCSDIIFLCFNNFLETPVESIFINELIKYFQKDLKYAHVIMSMFERFYRNTKIVNFIHLSLFKTIMMQVADYDDFKLSQKMLEFIAAFQTNIDFSKLPFRKMGDKIRIDQDLYETMLRLMSNSNRFIGIRSEVTTDLVRKIFKTEFFTDFMMKVKQLVDNSIVECYFCNKFDLSMRIIEEVQKRDNIEDVDLMLDVFKEINKWNSSRPILFSYLRLLSNESGKRSRYAEKLLQALSDTIRLSQDQVGYAFLFSSGSGSFIIPNTLQTNTFIINIYAIVCDPSDRQRFLAFKSEGDTISINLSTSKITVVKNCSVVTSKQILIDQNKWTNYTFEINPTEINLYIDNNEAVKIRCQTPIIKNSVDTFEVFCDDLTGEISHVSIFNGALDERLLNIIHADTVEYTAVIHEPSLLMLYSAHYAENGKVPNALQNQYESATTSCINLSFISSFRRIFEASKGTHFLTSLFSQIDFMTYDGVRNSEFLMQLLKCFNSIIVSAPQVQTIMEQIDTFSVMAHFLQQPNLNDYLTEELWNNVYQIEPHITNPKLLQQLQVNVLLNLELWKPSRKKAVTDFMLCCHRTSLFNESTFFSMFSLNSLCDFFLLLDERNEFNDTNLSILLELFERAAAIRFDRDELTTMLNMIAYFNGSEERVSILIKVMKRIANVVPSVWNCIAHQVIDIIDLVNIRIKIVKSLPKTHVSMAFSLLLSRFNTFSETKQREYFEAFNAAIEKNNWNPQLFAFTLGFAYKNPQWQEVMNQTCLLAFESNHFIERFTNLGMSTVGIITLYFMYTEDPLTVRIFGRFLAKDINIAKDVFAVSSVIESLTKMNFDKFVNQILFAMIPEVFATEKKDMRETYFHFIVDKIFIRHNHSTIYRTQLRNFEPVDIASFIMLLTTVKDNVSFKYGMSIDETNNTWLDENCAVELLSHAWGSFYEKCGHMIDYMCLIAIVFSRNITKEKQYLFSEVFQSLKNSEFAAPFLVNIAKFQDILKGQGHSINETLMQRSLEIMEQFYNEIIQRFDARKIFFESTVDSDTYQLDHNIEKIKEIERVKEKENANNHRRCWHRLWQTVSHDRSPFISSSSYIMMPHFKIGNHFDLHFMPSVLRVSNHYTNHIDARNKATIINPDALETKPASNFFFDREKNVSPSTVALIDILWRAPAERVKITRQNPGDFYVLQNGLVFKDSTKTIMIEKEKVKYIFWVWVNQHPNAIQIYTTEYEAFLFIFPKEESHKFVQSIYQIGFPNAEYLQENLPHIEIERLGITQKWIKRQMTNFDYLMWLNLLSGRSFLDSRIYPIFPILILDNESQQFDENNESSFRDLSKNLGFINPTFIERMQERISILKHNGAEPFCHPSYFSNAYIVNHYLIRIEPFTTLHIMLQDGHFDVGPRLFISLSDNIKRMLSKMPTFREFTPEFYQTETFLLNSNDLPLGKYNETDTIDDVGLPNWAKSPADFINRQRNVLESERVSNTINHWIDMLWGVKQRGPAASDAMNTYDPQIYPDIWINNAKTNTYVPEAVQAMLNTVGQIPQQLFSSPHPKRNPVVPEQFIDNAVALHNIPEEVSCVICSGATFEKMKVYAALKSGRVFCLRLAATNFEVQMMKHAKIPSDPKKIAHFKSETNDDFNFVFAQDHSSKVTVLNVIKRSVIRSKSSPHLSEINCISVAGNMILSGGLDACATLWQYDGKDSIEQLNFIMAHRSEITCCALSETFGVAVTCGPDNAMIIASLPELTFIRAVELGMPAGSIPTNVVMTQNSGYILVFHGNCAICFTVNGSLCNRAEFDCHIVSACVAENKMCMDFVLILLSNNNVLLIEPYSLKVIRTIWKGGDKIKEIGFHKDSNNFILITETANVILIPSFFSP